MFYIFSTGLGSECSAKEAITASFVRYFNENQENTIRVYFAVVLHGKTILLGNMNCYFYADSIATMLTASPDNGVTA